MSAARNPKVERRMSEARGLQADLLAAASNSGPDGEFVSSLDRLQPRVRATQARTKDFLIAQMAWSHAAALRRLAALDPTFSLEDYLQDLRDPRAALARMKQG